MFSNHAIVLNKDERPLIAVHHDESTFYINADQTNYWSDGTVTVLKQKSLGQAIMISKEASGDYITMAEGLTYSLKHKLMVTLSLCNSYIRLIMLLISSRQSIPPHRVCSYSTMLLATKSVQMMLSKWKT